MLDREVYMLQPNASPQSSNWSEGSAMLHLLEAALSTPHLLLAALYTYSLLLAAVPPLL